MTQQFTFCQAPFLILCTKAIYSDRWRASVHKLTCPHKCTKTYHGIPASCRARSNSLPSGDVPVYIGYLATYKSLPSYIHIFQETSILMTNVATMSNTILLFLLTNIKIYYPDQSPYQITFTITVCFSVWAPETFSSHLFHWCFASFSWIC